MGRDGTGRDGDGKGREGRKADGGETVGNSLGRAPLKKTQKIMTGWTEGETVGNSLGRAPLGRSEMEASTGWTEGKPWEIAWGEVRREGAIRKRRQGGRMGKDGEGKPWEKMVKQGN